MRLILLVLALVLAGCAGPRPDAPVTFPVPATQPAASFAATQPGSASSGVAIRLGGRDILYLTGVTAHLPRRSIHHAIVPQLDSAPPATGELMDDVVFSHTLAAAASGAPEMTCQIISRDNGRQVTIAVESASRLPQMSLTAVLPDGIHPARYHPPEGPHAIQAAIGPATRLLFDSLHDSTPGVYVTYSGDVSLEASSGAHTLRARTASTTNRRAVLLRLHLQESDREPGAAPRPSPSIDHLSPPASLREARRAASEWAVAPAADMAGLVLLPEALNRLPADRVELLRRICPMQPVRRVDRVSGATMWNLAIARPPEQWNVLVLSNPSVFPKTEAVSLDKLGISPRSEGRSAVYDFWLQQLVAVTDDVFEVDIPAGDCRVLCIRDVRPNEPCVVSTSSHITQGLQDLAEVVYDSQSLMLSGKSSLVPGDAYELRLLLPVEQKSLEVTAIDTVAASRMIRSDGPLRIVTFESDTEQTVAWSIRFRRAALPPLPPSPPARMSSRQNTRGVLLSWDTGERRPTRYHIYRDGKPLAIVAGSENEYQDSDVVYNTQYSYTIRSVDWAGRESQSLPQGVHRTPVPADAYLTQLVPLSMQQGPPPAANRSAGGNPLRMAGRRYHRGLGAVPGSRIDYFLGKGYDRFSGEVGIDDATTSKGRARFEILADDRLLFSSKPLAVGEAPQRFNVPVNGCRKLTLAVIKVGDGDGQLDANWGDTYLRASATPGR